MNDFIGYCKECGTAVYLEHEIMPGDGVYECPACSHPHCRDELWPMIPPYITEEERLYWGGLSKRSTEEF